MSRGIYTGTLSWLIHLTSNCSPDSATNGAYIGSYINSSFAGVLVGAVAFAYDAVTFACSTVVFVNGAVAFAYSIMVFGNGLVVLFACGAVVFIYGQ
jgi:hypothetical protein